MKTTFVKYVVSPSSELSTRTLGIMIGVELARVSVMYDAAIGVTNDGSRLTDVGTSKDLEL